MTKRIVNKRLIREWIKINGKGALERLALGSGCSASLIQKLCSECYDYGVPSIDRIDGICKVTGYEICELFPFADQVKVKEIA
jgi:hypothetical protein